MWDDTCCLLFYCPWKMLMCSSPTGFFHTAHKVNDQFYVGVKEQMPSATAVTKLYIVGVVFYITKTPSYSDVQTCVTTNSPFFLYYWALRQGEMGLVRNKGLVVNKRSRVHKQWKRFVRNKTASRRQSEISTKVVRVGQKNTHLKKPSPGTLLCPWM